MPQNTFGYEPAALPSNIARYDDYAAGQSIDYQPTPWDDFGRVNIETMWTWVQNESDEKTRAVAEMWRRIGVLLEATRANVERYAASLQQSWESPAATEFLRRVGAALYSLDEWHQAAVTNASALNTVADKISSTQTAMRDVWQRFTIAAADAERQRAEEKNDGVLMSITRGFTEDPPTHDEVRREFTNEAKPVMRALADTYTDSALSMQRGTMFKGPTEADTPVFSSGGPGGPGGSAGSVAGSGPGASGTPAMPAPPFSGADSKVPELAGMLPPAPGLPLPPAPVAPIAPTPPGTGPVPPMPGLPVPPPAGPRPPGTLNPPPRPGVDPRLPKPPGQSTIKAPPVSRPNLLGASPRPGVPATPGASQTPGTPRRPNLHGASPRGAGSAPARPSVPGTGVPTEAGTTAAPKLDGRHGSRPASPVRGATPGLARPGPSSGPVGSGATSPNLAGRRKPDPSGTPTVRSNGRRGHATTQVLGGRTAPPPSGTASAARSHGPQLGGRSGQAERMPGPAEPTDQHRRSGDERTRPGGGSDEDLWTVDGAPSGVEAPAPKPSANSRPARGHAE